MDKETQEKINQLQLMEQNIQNFSMQKQTFQSQQLEIENALKEIETTSGQTYKIVGGIMIATPKDKLKESLSSRKDVLNLRIKNIVKQEESIKEKMEKLQEEVMRQMENKDGK